MRRDVVKVTLTFLMAMVMAFSANGQTTNATLSGVVQDQQNAVIANATVVATQIDTGQKHTTKSRGDGHYIIPNLPIGNYHISAVSTGFKVLVIPSITLQVNQLAEVNLTLAVG